VLKGTGTQGQVAPGVVPCAFFLLKPEMSNQKLSMNKYEKRNCHKDTKSQRYTKKLYKNPWCLGALEAKKSKEGK